MIHQLPPSAEIDYWRVLPIRILRLIHSVDIRVVSPEEIELHTKQACEIGRFIAKTRIESTIYYTALVRYKEQSWLYEAYELDNALDWLNSHNPALLRLNAID